MYEPEDFDESDEVISEGADDIIDSGKNLTKKGAKVVGRKVAAVAKQAGKKLAEGAATVLKKYILIDVAIVVGILLVMVLLMSFGDVLVAERGPIQDYSQKAEESNVSGVDESGNRKVIALTEPQALKTAYYRLMSCASYSKMYKDSNIYFYDPQETNKQRAEDMREDFATLQDYNENERSFLLSSDFILMADEILHDSVAYYPEQIIKSLYYTKDEETGNVKTLPIFDEEKNKLKEEIVSTKYTKDENTGDYFKDEAAEKIHGLWDYGLGSVVQYAPKEKDVWMEGTILTRDVEIYVPPDPNDPNSKGEYIMEWNKPVNEPFKIPHLTIKNEKDKKIAGRTFHDPVLNKDFGNNTDTYPIKIPVVQSAALFSGSISYEYEEEIIETPFSNATSSDEQDNVSKIFIGKNHAGEPMYETREGSTFTKVPKKTNEKKDVLGFGYLDEYFNEYTNYVPVGLKNDLDFKQRTIETYDLLIELGLLRPYTGGNGNVQLGPIGGGAVDSEQGLNDGLNGNQGDVNWKTWNDLTMLAHLIAAESSNNKLDELMVGSVLMNRVASPQFPGSIAECITEDGVYKSFDKKDGGTFASVTPSFSHIQSAKQVLSGEFSTPENVLFQSKNQKDDLFLQVGTHSFCMPSGQKPDTKDRFARAALSASQLESLAEDLKTQDEQAEKEQKQEEDEKIERTPTFPVQPRTPTPPNGTIGGQHPVEVTYYCKACNSPPGSDVVAWAHGEGKGHAIAGVTCAMSKASQTAMGLKYGDYVYVNNLGIRRVEDLCGTGLGTSIKNDRIVIDIYMDFPDGRCHCSEQNNMTTTAYKTTGAGSTTPGGFFDRNSGIYHIDMNNPSGFSLYDSKPFDTLDATKAYEQFNDPNQAWFLNLMNKMGNKASDLFEGLKNAFNEWGVIKGLNSLFNKEALFTKEHYLTDPPSDISKTRDVVYQALAITQNKSYMDIVSTFDENNMDLIFVGNANPNGIGMGGGIINGTGTTVEGFVSPTDSYYQASEPFSPDKPYVSFAAPEGIEVHAIFDGKVDSVDIDSGSVTITHTHDTGVYKVVYGNINVSVSVDEDVKTEQFVGITRSGGFTLQVFKDGQLVDPMTIFYQPSIDGSGSSVAQIALNELATNGKTATPGDKYRQYWKGGATDNWCAYFAGYCFDQAGYIDAGLWPTRAEGLSVSNECIGWLKQKGWYYPRTSGYIPKAGDAIFFDWDLDGRANHIGIVLYPETTSQGMLIHTIEGNISDKLVTQKRRGYSEQVMGFGVPGRA